MRRVTLLLELLDDEAEQVIQAVSATSVRFGGVTLEKIVKLGMECAPPLKADMAIGHEACSDGAIYAGGPKYSLARLKSV